MMKRLLSVVLAATLLTSGIAMSSFSAAAAETENEQVYLLGDVDLDGEVTINDVTEIQRSLADAIELSGLQAELAKVNDEALSINTATLIQKYLAGLDTELPIGEEAGDENEGVVYAEKLPWYNYERGVLKQEEDSVYFSTKYPDVPFVSDSYVMQAICGQCNINIQNPNTWAIHQCVLDYDLNFDGKYDENDKSMLAMGFNVAVNISDVSFSCGNLLPNALDQLNDNILLIGQQSGGGACTVGYLSTAIGSTMQISSENRLSTMKNGYIRDIDGGIAPDVYLTVNRMFDREYIVDTINDYFG